MQEKCTFSADYLVVSRKSSTFARFFAAREYAHVCVSREMCNEEKQNKTFKLT